METGYSIKGLCPSCFPVNFAKLFGAVVHKTRPRDCFRILNK